MLKKLKAALGIATAWAVAWGVWGALSTGIFVILGAPYPMPVFQIVALSALRSGVLGFIGGALFSTVLGLRYRHRTLGELHAAPLGLWGAVAGLLVPVTLTLLTLSAVGYPITLPFLFQTALVYGIPGLATAYGTIKIAQGGAPELEDGDPFRPLTPGS